MKTTGPKPTPVTAEVVDLVPVPATEPIDKSNVIDAEVVEVTHANQEAQTAQQTLHQGAAPSAGNLDSQKMSGRRTLANGSLAVLSPKVMQQKLPKSTHKKPAGASGFLGQIDANPDQLVAFLMQKGFQTITYTPGGFSYSVPGQNLRAEVANGAQGWQVTVRQSYRDGDAWKTDTYCIKLNTEHDKNWQTKLRNQFRKKMPPGWFP